jgi:molybdopterin-guanine dinucleotide biosynthesis protein A
MLDCVLACVLVGGRSRRFGSDKADAEFNGHTLLNHQLGTLRIAGFLNRVYVGGEVRPNVAYEAVHVPDVDEAGDEAGDEAVVGNTDHSSLRGVRSALHAAELRNLPITLVVACDLPLVRPDTLQKLVAVLDTTTIDVAVAESLRTHWTCFAIRTSCRNDVDAAYTKGERAMYRALGGLRVASVIVDDDQMLNVNDSTALLAAITASRRRGE